MGKSELTIKSAGETKVVIPENATLKLVDNAKAFADVTTENWFNDAVAFATSRELFTGTSENIFAPNSTMNRAMLITVLHRLSGETAEAAGEAWYDSAADWATKESITDGTNLMGDISRQSLAVMLFRYAGSPTATGEGKTFTDGANVAAWAIEATDWAVKSGILSGKNDGRLDPAGTATRAEVATMLERLIALK